MVKPLIKDTNLPTKDKAKSTLVNAFCRKSPLKEDSLSTKDKKAGPEGGSTVF